MINEILEGIKIATQPMTDSFIKYGIPVIAIIGVIGIILAIIISKIKSKK